jgi:hypothetical protein
LCAQLGQAISYTSHRSRDDPLISKLLLFFNDAPIDPIAHRISEAVCAHPEGMSKVQIRALFHGHVSQERIELALQQLSTLGVIDDRRQPGRGRTSTIWTPAGGAKDAARGA